MIIKPGKSRAGSRNAQRGVAVLIVLVFVMIIGSLASDSGLVLRHVKQELRLLEQGQKRAHEKRLKRISTRSATQVAPPVVPTGKP